MFIHKTLTGFMLGMEKPFNLHKWAKDKGYIDNEGNLYYDEYRSSKLPNYEWQAQSYWMVNCNFLNYCFATIQLCGEAVKRYPIFKFTSLKVDRIVDNHDSINLKMLEPVGEFDEEYVNFEEYKDDCAWTPYNKIVDNPEDIINNWGIIKRKATKIEVFRTGKRRLTTDDGLEIWFPENIRVDVSLSSDIYLVISVYKRNDGSIGINGLGYWVKDRYRLW